MAGFWLTREEIWIAPALGVLAAASFRDCETKKCQSDFEVRACMVYPASFSNCSCFVRFGALMESIMGLP